MTIQDQRTVVSTESTGPADYPGSATSSTVATRRTTATPSGSEMSRRIIVLVFGLIQLVIGLRIVLLVIDARTGNDIVATVLNISQVFVAPFEGILKSDAIHAGGSQLDLAALAALVGWTVLEAIILWVVGIFRRDQITA